MKQGKLIVIDGTDGSGKGTQAALLMERFVKEGRGKEVKLADFPRYGNQSAYFVEKYLRGEYGSQKEVGSRRASLFYALDRYDASFEMREWLKEGMIVVSNRYTSSNMGHQAGQMSDASERSACISWIKELEYELLGIPKPDANILLYVTPEMGQQLVDRKSARAYTKGKKRDIHEADIEHLRRASDAYLEVAKKEEWKIIDCMKGKDEMRDKHEVHEEIYQYLNDKKII